MEENHKLTQSQEKTNKTRRLRNVEWTLKNETYQSKIAWKVRGSN